MTECAVAIVVLVIRVLKLAHKRLLSCESGQVFGFIPHLLHIVANFDEHPVASD